MADKKNDKKIKEHEKQISYQNENGWEKISENEKKKIFDYSKDYAAFITNHKTEREISSFFLEYANKNNFKNIEEANILESGKNYFFYFRNKTLVFVRIPKKLNIKNEKVFHVVGSHIDSPRLDLKPNPLKEDASMLLLKTHYYGGIKKYQWSGIPLSIHGVVITKKGKLSINIGEKEEEPVFTLPDLLPHLGKEQMKKEGSKLIEGEEMGVIFGHIPHSSELKSKIKYNILSLIEKKYGIIEKDFIRSELCLVPAFKARDIGLDKGLLAAYGQDDRVCAYSGFKSFTDTNKHDKIIVSLWIDKEEVGSMGDTGAKSFMIEYLYEMIIKKAKLNISTIEGFIRTDMLSGDVTGGMNPNFKSVHDESNVSYLGHGVSIEKYGGGGGKSNTNDASAEYMNYIIEIMDKNSIKWQTGELGKIDLGGGGTIAAFFSSRGARVVDVGPPLLGMHSPYEVLSKLDIYNTYKAYKAFFTA